MRNLKTLFENLLGRGKPKLTPRDQARLRLASELGPRKATPAYAPPTPVPWYDRALERLRRDSDWDRP